jgi:hypothetical protein
LRQAQRHIEKILVARTDLERGFNRCPKIIPENTENITFVVAMLTSLGYSYDAKAFEFQQGV